MGYIQFSTFVGKHDDQTPASINLLFAEEFFSKSFCQKGSSTTESHCQPDCKVINLQMNEVTKKTLGPNREEIPDVLSDGHTA